MYVIETLKKEFPECNEDLVAYDQFLRRHYPEETLYKIFDDAKENFKYLHEAFEEKKIHHIVIYNRNMCWYGQSLNNAPDFLRHYLTALGKDVPDDSSVQDMKKMIEEMYK